jgi:hypothetical protein
VSTPENHVVIFRNHALWLWQQDDRSVTCLENGLKKAKQKFRVKIVRRNSVVPITNNSWEDTLRTRSTRRTASATAFIRCA